VGRCAASPSWKINFAWFPTCSESGRLNGQVERKDRARDRQQQRHRTGDGQEVRPGRGAGLLTGRREKELAEASREIGKNVTALAEINRATHEAELQTMARLFADVQTTDEVVAMLASATTARG
jgi:hypothetical protein